MFSTLHTNTAIGAIPRLVDMGIEPFLLASSLRMVMSQRLARRICEHCKEEREISDRIKENLLEAIKDVSPEELKKYGLDLSQGPKVFQGRGCERCNGTGLKGRIAIYEVVPINDAIKNIISEKNGEEGLLVQERSRSRIITMKQDGIMKIMKGMTTIEEVERVTEGNITLEEENI
ncbi:MAG: GspE/PulE family protein, partial [Patescibacteria group bacterium]